MKRFGLWQLVLAAVLRRQARAGLALSALAIGAALSTTLLTVYAGVGHNLSREFRVYGANLVVTPQAPAKLLAAAQLTSVPGLLPAGAKVAGILYAIGRAGRSGSQDKTLVVFAGANVRQLRRMNPTWRWSPSAGRVASFAPSSASASLPWTWVGVNAARQLQLRPGSLLLASFGQRQQTWQVAGTVSSGASEDNQIFTSRPTLQALTGLGGVTTIEIQAPTQPRRMAALVARLRRQLPGTNVSPVRRIAVSESHIILNTGGMLLASSLLILLTIGLCVAAALTSMALERRRIFGIMKALGGSERRVFFNFVAESSLIGLAAAVAGIALGVVAAGAIGETVFRVWLRPTAGILFLTAAVTVLLATLAALTPWPLVRAASPAEILRGE